MKKYGIFFITLFVFLLTGCSIDYTSYYEKYGDVSNKEYPKSYYLEDVVLSYPNDNSFLIDKYGEVYEELVGEYKVYSSYYSTYYDTLYISYDKIDAPIQTINSRELMMMEEHLLNYFTNENDYKEYLKVVRIYPDYHSSTCRSIEDDEESYSQIEGCANYNALEASINLNNLTSINKFFNPSEGVEDGYKWYSEPKRDTFAHEFGHVSTYYYLILKGDDSYAEYLKIRLGEEAYNSIYPAGLPDEYNLSQSYYTQPVEILADDYVELFYDTSKKKDNDYYDYDLAYDNYRNSLKNTPNVVKNLRDDSELFNRVKDYYSLLIDNDYQEYENKKVVNVTGDTYNTMHDVVSGNKYVHLDGKDVVVLGEVTINNQEYYRIVLSNIVKESNSRREYGENIGYILKSNAIDKDNNVIHFTKYNGETMAVNSGLTIDHHYHIYAYYDFSYYICDGNYIRIYSYLDSAEILIQRHLYLFE